MNGKKLLIGGAGLLLALVILLLARPKPTDRPVRPDRTAAEQAEDNERARTRVGKWNVAEEKTGRAKSGSDAATTRSANALTTRTALVGFLVDDFRSWTAIPEGYFSDGVTLRNGSLTLSAGADTSEPLTGVFQSPSLPLWQPSQSAPAISQADLPEGASINAEISLSRDGKTWGGWLLAGRYQKPDGSQAVPIEQPRWNGIRPADRQPAAEEGITSGPRIRYRLTLTGVSGQYPVIRDFRIWHNTLAYPGDR